MPADFLFQNGDFHFSEMMISLERTGDVFISGIFINRGCTPEEADRIEQIRMINIDLCDNPKAESENRRESETFVRLPLSDLREADW